ncbi:MAG: hypothetical protein HOW97_39700 [Catenulispora sp.]|nr:hypothetical protein [Catenulispora sp.]NUS29154.1 hypothetical protein [Streptomyces sp.]
MTSLERKDPAERAEAYSVTLTAPPLPESTVAAARRYIAGRAWDAADEQLLLAALGLDQLA